MEKITTENATSYPAFTQTIEYYLIMEEFIDINNIKISLVKQILENSDLKDTKKLFTKSINDIPKEWLKGSSLSIELFIQDDENRFTELKYHTIKNVYLRKNWKPIFDENGVFTGTTVWVDYSKTFLDKNTNREFKTETLTAEQSEKALLWLIQFQGEKRMAEKKLLSVELRNKLNKNYKPEFWAVPVYVNGHICGARVVSELTNYGNNFRQEHEPISKEDFLTLI